MLIGYFPGTRISQIRELKEEILSNLEAKVADLTSNGMEYYQAVSTAVEQFDHIDGLIDDNKEVYMGNASKRNCGIP
ncbi:MULTISPECIES: permease prefix domain 1-containing protein [Paenibacillus]|uniref:Uncharacterized protein n=1 Tax=Paenibacillus naphthalenovorans TaxID=162209 RepID=A0A0U2W9F6_9BACL|nr:MULTISPECIES: permease prefix domain 1-containing protein [Paenibacillus]ALS24093.1 hypothetical protein IJ22_37550 [Paenibacillus naphthalenovorans]GCL72310.1 hypothetical protein PN4B1_22150 [Paenibacillus naphthalenovorans]